MIAAIDSVARLALERGPIAGLSIAVMQEGDLVVSKGYGFADLENAVAASETTIYNIASVTKLLTATAVMNLVDSRVLNLDDDLTTLLPAFPNPAQGRRITLRHLLSHTSGLRDYEDADTERWTTEGTPLTPAFVLDFLRHRPLDFNPGSAFSYSNSGFYLLGLIVEHATGQDFGAYVRARVTRPLGLTDTFYCDEALHPERMADGYEIDGNRMVPGRLYTAAGIIGDGGMCSTVGDLVRLPRALRSGRMLSEIVLDEMTKPTTISSGGSVDYGLGTRLGRLDGHRLWGHTGGMGTYWAVLADYPDDAVTIAVLVNTDGAAEDALTIEGRIARAVIGLDEPRLQDIALSTEDIGRFSGLYTDGATTVRLYEEGGRFLRAVQNSDRDPRALVHQGHAHFGWSEFPMDRLVVHVKGDQVLGLSEYYNGVFATFRRPVH